VPVSKVEDMTSKDYRPGGCTPLYDAMGKAISHLDACINEGDAVLVMIITDGYENSSEEFSRDTNVIVFQYLWPSSKFDVQLKIATFESIFVH